MSQKRFRGRWIEKLRIGFAYLALRLPRDSVLECASPLALRLCEVARKAPEGWRSPRPGGRSQAKNQDRQITITVNNPIIMTERAFAEHAANNPSIAPRPAREAFLNVVAADHFEEQRAEERAEDNSGQVEKTDRRSRQSRRPPPRARSRRIVWRRRRWPGIERPRTAPRAREHAQHNPIDASVAEVKAGVRWPQRGSRACPAIPAGASR